MHRRMESLMKLLWLLIPTMTLACGCDAPDQKVAETAGSKIGEALTEFAGGMGEGIDKQMEVRVELSEQFPETGLSKTVGKSRGFKEGIVVYFISERPFSGQMTAKAFNADGQEVGRAKVDVEFEADDAKYVDFVFSDAMDSQLVEKYLIDVRAASATTGESADSDPPNEAAG